MNPFKFLMLLLFAAIAAGEFFPQQTVGWGKYIAAYLVIATAISCVDEVCSAIRASKGTP